MSCRAWTALGTVLTLSWLSWASASEPASAPAQPPKPMSITSGSMTVKNLEQRVVFDRDVTITNGDMDLSADRVEVILVRSADSGGEGQPFAGGMGPNLLAQENIERIEAEGRVKVVQGKKTATADHAVYQRAEETVVLTGHPETWEEGVRIQGSKITILLKEQRSIVEESRVVIYPEAQGGDAAAPPTPHTDGG
jgi:lipopolysaccharide export system protein LptA